MYSSVDMKTIQEVVDELREMSYVLHDKFPQLSDEQLIKRLDKCADTLDRLVAQKIE